MATYDDAVDDAAHELHETLSGLLDRFDAKNEKVRVAEYEAEMTIAEALFKRDLGTTSTNVVPLNVRQQYRRMARRIIAVRMDEQTKRDERTRV